MIVEIPVNVGTLIDKLTILQIKHQQAVTDDQRSRIDRQLQQLQQRADGANLGGHPMFEGLLAELTRVNRQRWELESTIRNCIERRDYGDLFIGTAQEIVRVNDRRSELKRIANEVYHCEFFDEKIYN